MMDATENVGWQLPAGFIEFMEVNQEKAMAGLVNMNEPYRMSLQQTVL